MYPYMIATRPLPLTPCGSHSNPAGIRYAWTGAGAGAAGFGALVADLAYDL